MGQLEKKKGGCKGVGQSQEQIKRVPRGAEKGSSCGKVNSMQTEPKIRIWSCEGRGGGLSTFPKSKGIKRSWEVEDHSSRKRMADMSNMITCTGKEKEAFQNQNTWKILLNRKRGGEEMEKERSFWSMKSRKRENRRCKTLSWKREGGEGMCLPKD